jgi:hypothetical protein
MTIESTDIESMNKDNRIFSANDGENVGSTPKIAGWYRFSFTKKPNMVNRFFCKICLGWQWIDEE